MWHRGTADYAHLRDLCGTDIDGTSIDALEDVGRELGGDLEQIVTPIEQALAAQPAPARDERDSAK